jgi:hypothetical protein
MIHRETTPLLIAFIASLALHFAVIPIITNKQIPYPFAPPPDASHLETPPNDAPEVELGIEKSNVSTLTWIGYEKYQKHLARLAIVEQAAMQLEQVTPRPTPKEIAIEQPHKNVDQILHELSNTITPLTDIATQFIDALRGIRFSIASPPPPPPIHPTPKQKQTVEPETTIVAEPAELESDATSIVEVPRESWKTGRPVAAEGIILRPRRPSFTAHQSITNASGGFSAVLIIDHRGRPTDVQIVQGTGSASIDRSLVASLFRWRATGEKIDNIIGDATIDITIHISFSR